MKLRLDVSIAQKRHGLTHWKRCYPFIRNSRATLVHRPRRVSTHKCVGRSRHLAVEMFCGQHITGRETLEFTDTLDNHEVVCVKCEAAARDISIHPSTDEIVGRHVCKGNMKLGITCCGKNSVDQAKAALQQAFGIVELEVKEPWDKNTEALAKRVLEQLEIANAFLKFKG